MDVNVDSLLPLTEVLADVLVALQDQEQKKLTPGFYRAQVKYALDELGFDALFYVVTKDIALPDNLKVPMPSGVFNLRSMNIYTGTPDNVGYVENVYWRRNVTTRGKGTGHTARVNEGNITDPFIQAPFWTIGPYYFNVQNGLIFLSDYCESFDYVRLVYNGIPSGNLDEVRMIPREARKAIALWVIEKCAGYLKLENNMYRAIQIDAANQLDEYGLNGAWHQAKKRINSLDKKQLQDIILYTSKMDY